MSKKEFEMGAVCLGHSGMVASWWRTAADTDKRLRRQPEITIFESAASDENVYIPAASVKIYGAERLRALRSVIEEALRNEPEGGVEMTGEFMREERYIVFKLSDLGNSLKGDEIRRLAREYAEQRRLKGKKPLECVVVEKDWPEYEPTWRAIEARVAGAKGEDK